MGRPRGGKAGPEAEVWWGVSGILVAMETGQARDRWSAESGSYAFSGATWTPSSRLTRILSPSQSARLSSLAYPDDVHHSFRTWPRRLSPLAPSPSPEPQLLRLRPTSLRTQDISHLLTSVFRNLYTAEVIGEEVSASLIKARGSENERHEEFVDELQQVTAPRPRALFTRGSAPADRNGDYAWDPGRAPQKGWTSVSTCWVPGTVPCTGDAAGKEPSPSPTFW